MSLVQDPSTGTAANVKGASTAPLATDASLVVTISPNSPSISVTTDGFVTTSPPTYTAGTSQALSLTTTGLLRIDGSNVIQPVSGTVAATQSGTWTVQPGNTANTTPWLITINQGGNSATVTASNALKVDGSAITQPVSGVGTFTVVQATAANLNATVTGTVTANIGTTNGLALDTSVNGILVAQGSTTSGEKGPLTQGAVTTSAPAYTTAQTSPFSLTTTGLLRIDGVYPVNATTPTTDITFAGGAVTTAAPAYTTGQLSAFSLNTSGGLRVDGSGVTQPVSGTVTANAGTGTFTVAGTVTANQGTSPWVNNVSQFGGSNVVTGTGASGVGIPRVTVSSDSNVLTTQSGTWTVQPGNTANTTPWLVTDSSDGPVTPGAVAGKSLLIGGQFNTALPTLANTQQAAIQLDSSGRVLIGSIPTGANVIGAVTQSGTWNVTATASGNFNNASVSATGAAGPASATYVGGAVTTATPTYTTGQMDPLSLTTAGALRIDGSGTTQPVSGTVTANAGTGNFTVVQATAANLNATITGTVTANIGTTNGLALDTSVNGILVTQGSATSGEKGPLIQGAVTTASPAYTTAQTSPLSLTTAGALRIDGSATTQPVSGTVTANAGTGNFTVVQATAANLNATVVGTVTANIGTTNGLALDTSVNGILVTQGSTTSGEKGPLIQGSVTTAAPAYTTAQTSPLSLTTAGALRIDGSASTQPVSGTVAVTQSTSPWVDNITQFGGTNVSTGTGVGGAGIPRVTVSNDSNVLSTQSGTWTVQPGNTANTTPWLASISQGGNTTAVKAASTAAVATDPAVVVAISPNNTISVGPVTVSQADTTGTGTLNALNTNASIVLAGTAGAAMQLLAGTLVGTIVPEVSVDGGTTWVGTSFDDPVTGNKVNSIVFGSSNTATTRSIVSVAGASNYRVRVSLYTSGTATCNLRATTQVDPSSLYAGAAGAALPLTIAQVGGSVTTAAPAYTTATVNALSLNTSGGLRVDGSGVTQPVSGTVTSNAGTGSFNNASVSTTAAAPPGSATYVGASVTTNAPAYTTGQMDPLSLTTAGLLRVDGVFPINATTPTTDITFVGGGVTTAAPAYTTGQLSALSLTTGGNLRTVTASEAGTAATTPTTASLAGGAVTTAAPAYTTGQMDALSLTTAGLLRVDGAYPINATTPTTDGVFMAAAVTTAAPAYTTGQMSALSLTTGGALRANVKSTIQPLYGTSGQTITITLASLANAAARQSAVVSNTTNLYEDALLFIKITPAAAAVSATGYVNIYAYGTVDGGTNYPEAVTGADAAYTVLTSTNLVLLAQINVVANTTARSIGPISFCRTYGMDRLPASWGIVVQNETGAAFNATAGNFTVEYQGVNGQLV